MLTAFGALAVTFMMVIYALESRGRGYILGFSCGCLLSSAYGFLAGAWPFGVIEVIWAGVAVKRYRDRRAQESWTAQIGAAVFGPPRPSQWGVARR
jgi:hypothetical protein